MTFNELGLIDPILKALEEKGYTQPSPIQEQAIPILLQGTDLLGVAQTGTGKTAAFAVPILQHLYKMKKEKGHKRIKALIVTPTRELAIQIGDSFSAYGKHTGLRNTVIFGGVKQSKQTNELRRGVDILVATPGRLLDLMGQGYISLRDIKFFVLDEADHMLDMGFIHDIRKLLEKLPVRRQSLFFSATMPTSIVKLSRTILGEFEQVTIKPKQATAERVEQALYFVAKKDKVNLLVHILETRHDDAVLVFSRTKHGADKIVKKLLKANVKAAAIHGNKSQNNRQRTLAQFKNREIRVLVATDIAARGIDVSALSLVINFDLPNISETYVHRIGRTGRALASGIALSFCMMEERPYLKGIEKLIRQQIPVIEDHPFPDDGTAPPSPKPQNRGQHNRNKNKRRRPNNSNNSRNRNRRNND